MYVLKFFVHFRVGCFGKCRCSSAEPAYLSLIDSKATKKT